MQIQRWKEWKITSLRCERHCEGDRRNNKQFGLLDYDALWWKIWRKHLDFHCNRELLLESTNPPAYSSPDKPDRDIFFPDLELSGTLQVESQVENRNKDYRSWTKSAFSRERKLCRTSWSSPYQNWKVRYFWIFPYVFFTCSSWANRWILVENSSVKKEISCESALDPTAISSRPEISAKFRGQPAVSWGVSRDPLQLSERTSLKFRAKFEPFSHWAKLNSSWWSSLQKFYSGPNSVVMSTVVSIVNVHWDVDITIVDYRSPFLISVVRRECLRYASTKRWEAFRSRWLRTKIDADYGVSSTSWGTQQYRHRFSLKDRILVESLPLTSSSNRETPSPR